MVPIGIFSFIIEMSPIQLFKLYGIGKHDNALPISEIRNPNIFVGWMIFIKYVAYWPLLVQIPELVGCRVPIE